MKSACKIVTIGLASTLALSGCKEDKEDKIPELSDLQKSTQASAAFLMSCTKTIGNEGKDVYINQGKPWEKFFSGKRDEESGIKSIEFGNTDYTASDDNELVLNGNSIYASIEIPNHSTVEIHEGGNFGVLEPGEYKYEYSNTWDEERQIEVAQGYYDEFLEYMEEISIENGVCSESN